MVLKSIFVTPISIRRRRRSCPIECSPYSCHVDTLRVNDRNKIVAVRLGCMDVLGRSHTPWGEQSAAILRSRSKGACSTICLSSLP